MVISKIKTKYAAYQKDKEDRQAFARKVRAETREIEREAYLKQAKVEAERRGKMKARNKGSGISATVRKTAREIGKSYERQARKKPIRVRDII